MHQASTSKYELQEPANNLYFDTEFPLDLEFKNKRKRVNMRMFNFSKALEDAEMKATQIVPVQKKHKKERYQVLEEEIISNEQRPQSHEY